MPRGVYEHKKNQGFQKGHVLNVGRKASAEARKKMSENMIGNTRGVGHVSWLRGKKGYTNSGSFKKGGTSWCKGKKGIHLSPETEFKKGMLGEKSGRWNGGKSMHDLGYVRIYFPSHPYANGRYVFEHRLVVEKMIGRYLEPHEPVHHLFKKTDNLPHQLMAFTGKRAHNKFHKDPESVKPSEIIFDGRRI